MSKIQEIIEDWRELDPKKKIFLSVFAVAGISFIGIHHFVHQAEEERAEAAAAIAADDPQNSGGGVVAGMPPTAGQPKASHFDVLPRNERNQGLEDMNLRLNQMQEQMGKMMDLMAQKGINQPATARQGYQGDQQSGGIIQPDGAASATVNLNDPLEPGPGSKVNFNEQPKGGKAKQAPSSGSVDQTSPANGTDSTAELGLNQPESKEWPSESASLNKTAAAPEPPAIVIPVNSGLDGIMMSGVNARQAGATTGASGSSTSALNVGAPFVTKLKGEASLPNGWKVSELGDCRVGGTATAVLSTSRAYAISDKLSCIRPNGEVWEGDIKAYALDGDGTLGIAGKVVSKQGSILLKTALAGIAAGIGGAFQPTPITAYNSAAVSGAQQGYQLPNGSLIAGTALSQGMNNAGNQLAKFYLDYAHEIFPVVEVPTLTRVTWVLKESLVLKRNDNLQKVAMK